MLAVDPAQCAENLSEGRLERFRPTSPWAGERVSERKTVRRFRKMTFGRRERTPDRQIKQVSDTSVIAN